MGITSLSKVFEKTVTENVELKYKNMFLAEKKVARYILEYPEKAVHMNVSELAIKSGVSDATVIRMCKRAGYEGYYQMRLRLSHDMGRGELKNSKDKSHETLINLSGMITKDIENMFNFVDLKTLVEAAKLIKSSKTTHIAAAGNSAPIAVDLGFRLGRKGIKTTFSMVPEYFLNSIDLATKGDVIIAISRSGSSKQTLYALELAKQKELKTLVVTGSAYSPMTELADILLITGTNNALSEDSQPDSHVKEFIINDLILYFIEYLTDLRSDGKKRISDVELMLSEYKL